MTFDPLGKILGKKIKVDLKSRNKRIVAGWGQKETIKYDADLLCPVCARAGRPICRHCRKELLGE